MNGLRSRLCRGVVLVAFVVMLGAMPAAVSADSPISHSGQRGAHALVDSPEFPGAWCDYDSQERLYRVRVRWPHVEGYNHTSSSRDYQKVSWRFQLYRDNGSPVLYYQSPLSVDYTYDNEAAYWPSKTYNFPSVAPIGIYTIYVQMYWYKPASVVNGTAVHAPDYIRHNWSKMPFFDTNCNYLIL